MEVRRDEKSTDATLRSPAVEIVKSVESVKSVKNVKIVVEKGAARQGRRK
jgi:hypothetical protein